VELEAFADMQPTTVRHRLVDDNLIATVAARGAPVQDDRARDATYAVTERDVRG
jgi:hypothetical protein